MYDLKQTLLIGRHNFQEEWPRVVLANGENIISPYSLDTCPQADLANGKIWILKKNDLKQFLDAFSHLYMRVCPSVGPSIRRSVGR